MTQDLNEFISSVRLADSIEHEKFLIKSEQADIRSYIRNCDPTIRPRIVAKLLFLNILGENVSYGQMEIITLMNHDRFSHKRIGYVAAAATLDEASELTVLLTHTVTKDLESPNVKIQCLALAFVANMGSVDLCQACVTHVVKLTTSSNPTVMKKSAMAACRIVQRIPELADSFKQSVGRLLKHGAHGVVIAAINLMENSIKAQPEMRSGWMRYASAFTKILRQLNQSKASREFAFTVFNDPFLQVRLMKILAILNKPSDDLDDVLELITTGTDIRRNTGRTLLFQAVNTIVATAKKPSLRGLAFSQIGRLLQYKEANVLYSALSAYSQVLYSGREIVGRTTGDTIALQRYKSLVVKCLSHRDGSIRRRALDVISALVDEKNVESLIPEVLDYIKLADSEFRIELVAKIFSAIQRFAPNPKWNFDMVHRILIENGNYVGSDILISFCKLISKSSELQNYAVTQLSSSMINFCDTQVLMQVTAWVLGEFSRKDDSSFDSLKRIMKMPQTTPITVGYIITALAKLAVRFGKQSTLINDLKSLYSSFDLDVQQRAYEISSILKNDPQAPEIFAPTSNLDESQNQQTLVVDDENNQNDKDNNDDDLLLLIDDPNPSSKPIQQNTNNKEHSALEDLLTLTIPSNTTPSTNELPQIKPPPGALEALRTPDYVIFFEIRKNPQNQKNIAIRASIFNLGKIALKNFGIKYGVPYGWMLQTQPPSSTTLEPIGGAPILQQIILLTQTDTPLMMKTQITYVYGSQPIVENGQINPIFN